MTESNLMTPDLDLLAERVERAAALVASLREEKLALTRERDELAHRIDEMRERLQGQDAAALVTELQQLRKEQKEWHGERREVASRIETLVRKLERLEG
jgi:chromosome segregation ATPase